MENILRVAAVEFRQKDLNCIRHSDQLLQWIEHCIDKAVSQRAAIIVFPAFIGCLFTMLDKGCRNLQDLFLVSGGLEYIEEICKLSLKKDITICSGSFWYKEDGQTYHAAAIVDHGELILIQKQIYLAGWERSLGMARGTEVKVIKVRDWAIGILLSTDVFYPQVSRALRMMQTELVLSPVGFIGEKNPVMQLSGLWKEVQQNQFYAVESSFNGILGEYEFWGEAIIHAPLLATEDQSGFLIRGSEAGCVSTAVLDNDKRKKAVSMFDVIAQLNPDFYLRMNMLGGKP